MLRHVAQTVDQNGRQKRSQWLPEKRAAERLISSPAEKRRRGRPRRSNGDKSRWRNADGLRLVGLKRGGQVGQRPGPAATLHVVPIQK